MTSGSQTQNKLPNLSNYTFLLHSSHLFLFFHISERTKSFQPITYWTYTRLTYSYLIEHTDPPKCNQLLTGSIPYMVIHDINTIPLLTLKTSSITEPKCTKTIF